MDPSDEDVQTLLAMGFPSESEVRRALKMAKNDLSDAVDILTNGQVMSTYDDLQGPISGNQDAAASMDTTDSQDFPATNLYELESRVFTDSWSIPYREDESLAKCMLASITLLAEGRAAQDDLCSRFLDRCLPDAFKKLLNSQAIYKWSADIQEGVYDMILILMELLATSLQLPAKGEQTYIPHILLETLALSFNPDCEYHQKNKSMKTKVEQWDEKLGADRVICFPMKSSLGSKEYCWLANLVNKFHYHGGFDMITDVITLPKTNLAAMASLVLPLAACSEFLAPKVAKPLFEKSMKRVMLIVEHLGPDDFREKNIGKACELLTNMKVICQSLWPSYVKDADDKRLDLVLRMIKSSHFNAKMNALIEITKMIEDATASRHSIKGAIPLTTLTQWMAEKELLSIILAGSIDQAQYCEKVKRIVEHVGPHLSKEDLEKLWNRTTDQTSHVIDNIHSIFAAAASQFTVDQFSAFTQLVSSNWSSEPVSMKEKLITLLAQIGKDTKNHELAHKVLEVMWELCHSADMSRLLVDKCLDEMHDVLVASSVIKESYKRRYLDKCVDCIKKGQRIMPSLRQLLNLVRHLVKQAATRAEKSRLLSDIHRSSEIIKLLVSSLIACHNRSVTCAQRQGVGLYPYLMIDDNYNHKEYMEEHLQCLQFILQEGTNFFMSWNRVKEFWECMVNSADACEWDRNTCYTWLTERINELETDAVCNLFTKKLMAEHCQSQLNAHGFDCWKKFFEQINLHQHNLKKSTAGPFVVEKMELTGLDELWSLCLNIRDVCVSQRAIDFLLENLYINLSPKFKRDVAVLHRQFIKECHERLEALLISLRGGGSAVYRMLSQALYQLTAVAVPRLEQMPAPLKPQYTLNIERLLLIVEQYVLRVEEVYQSPRSILPHGLSFYGFPLTLNCECETSKEVFSVQTHKNESLLSFRSLVADCLKASPDDIIFNQSELKSNKNQRSLGQLGLDDGQKVMFRLSYAANRSSTASAQAASLSAANESSASQAAASVVAAATSPMKPGNWELERNLPGVMIGQNSQVFKLLYQLAELGERRITRRIVALLHLIPTDPSVIDLVDSIATADAADSQASSAMSTPCASPSPSPRKVKAASGATYGSQTSVVSRRSSNSLGRMTGLFPVTRSNAEISPFQVRYNLEVLSSRVMPVDMPANQQSQFCEEFLTSGGLSQIMQIFQVDHFPTDVEYEIRQACYSLALQLILYLLFGETVRSSSPLADVVSSHPLAVMEMSEVMDLVSCMMRVSWAASVGKLHLSNSMQPTKDTNMYGRLRQSSADSSTSSSSEAEATCLHAGICLSHTAVDSVDTSIAVKAFEILTYCMCAKPELLGNFYSLPCLADFLLDELTGCCQDEIRTCAASCLKSLVDKTPSQESVEHPKYYLLQMVLGARLPYWVSHASTRGSRQRLLSQCLQYFDLRCHLLQRLTKLEQEQLSLDITMMIEDEIAWLNNFQPIDKSTSDLSTEQILLTGHLRLVHSLLTCEGVDVNKHASLIHTLLDDFLFPAAKLELSADAHDSLCDFAPKCMVSLSQTSAYHVLIEMCSRDVNCLHTVSSKLVGWHHSYAETNEWEYMPPVEGRASSGFVGLKNGGATCYMNSVIQQMYMTPGIVDAVLNVETPDDEEETKSVFSEMQQVFGHLVDSQLQYYEPDNLWHVFKLWGQSVNVREQQDAFDFFTALTDQLDETMKSLGREPVFQHRLQGVFSDQKNCEDCPHRYEREEPFFALNLTVSNPSLEQSLDQFVRGELLEGDNAYYCEKCNQKRSAIKRMCIKSLPPVLCIHLKRFSFDWEANRALKFDDYFKFPMELDMGPYTTDQKRSMYDLVGMVVHTGQASAGHYYSFIKDRRVTPKANGTYGKWFKFNDTTVEEFYLTEETLASECFGGRYKVKNTDNGFAKLPEDRVRYWNAYLLFYEQRVNLRTVGNRRSSRLQVLRKSQTTVSGSRQDSLSELSDLVHQGEKQGMFISKMPGRVQRSVRLENLRFLRNRNVFSQQYFDFVFSLSTVAASDDDEQTLRLLIEMAIKFILNTYLRTKEMLRGDMRQWYDWLQQAFRRCPSAVAWFIDYVTEDPHMYLIPYLLSCCIKDIRVFFSDILCHPLEPYMVHLQITSQSSDKLNILLETLLALLNREAVEYSKNSHEYFLLFHEFSNMSDLACDYLMNHDVLPQFIYFLIGKLPDDSSNVSFDTQSRRFSTLQTREFGPLHRTIAVLLLHLDLRVNAIRSTLKEDQFPSLKMEPNALFRVSDDSDIVRILSDKYCHLYIREALLCLKEMDSSTVFIVVDALVYLCHLLPHFTDTVIKLVLQQISSTPGNELKGVIKLATQICLLPDEAQESRLKALISDATDGILRQVRDSHDSDSQKSYQLIKLLTGASDRSTVVAQFLLSCSKHWQWCLDWLRKKMEEQSWTSQYGSSNENSLTKNFQRTVSAQATLEKATAMFTTSQGSSSDMDVDSINSEDLQTVPDLESAAPDC